MGSSINITSIVVTDFVGVLLLIIILLTNGWVLPARKKESRILLFMLCISALDCIGDAVISYLDGVPGKTVYYCVFLGNTYLYLYNLMIGICIIYLVVKHIGSKVPKLQIVFFLVLSAVEVTLLIVNFFYPVVFAIDENNIYHRGDYYFVFILAGFLLILYGFIFYFVSKLKNPSLRYFPVWQFLLPIIMGVLVQVELYGISLQPVSFTISFTGLVICLQNECIYIDKLTGVYNRFELDKVIKLLMRKRKPEKIAAMMIDLNGFKQINDNYSHSAGDDALVAFANILVEVIGVTGFVIRFAGDEFIIIIRNFKEDNINSYRDKIHSAIDEYNSSSDKPYELSAAIGGSVFEYDVNNEDAAKFLDKIDALMYKDKKEYYKTHGHR